MRTRLVVLLTALAAVVTACGGGSEAAPGASTGTPTSTVESVASGPDGAVATETTVASDPADDDVTRVLFAGDSLMQEIHPTMAAALGDSAETRFLLSPRLIRDDAEKLIWQATLDDFQPDVVVVIFSHWERLVLGAQTAEDVEDVDAYADLVALPFAEFVADNGAAVVWLSAPPLSDERITAVYAVMNVAYRSATAAARDARFVDLGPTLTDATGAYAESLTNALGVVERVRRTDGAHLCPDGAVRVAEAVLAPLAEVAGTTTAPDWQNGDWRTEAPFDKPDECPAL